MIDDISSVKLLKTAFNYLDSFPIYMPYCETIFFSLFLVFFNQNSSHLKQKVVSKRIHVTTLFRV